MKKRAIVLADNSYTIRRIIELSFSEVENVEVISFENGQGLTEKLVEIRPAAVLVDIKLPGTDGYEICRFINEHPQLSKTSVYLMKGGFEAVSTEKTKSLRYNDIITKPFDSNVLLQTVLKSLDQETEAPEILPESEPASFPEELPEIEAGIAEEDDISFSDIKREIEAVNSRAIEQMTREQEKDSSEILPSEEITQGTQPTRDNLLFENEEEIINPFADMAAEKPAAPVPPPAASPASTLPDFDLNTFPASPAAPSELVSEEEEFGRFGEIANEDTSEMPTKSPLDESGDLEDRFPLTSPFAQEQEEDSPTPVPKQSSPLDDLSFPLEIPTKQPQEISFSADEEFPIEQAFKTQTAPQSPLDTLIPEFRPEAEPALFPDESPAQEVTPAASAAAAVTVQEFPLEPLAVEPEPFVEPVQPVVEEEEKEAAPQAPATAAAEVPPVAPATVVLPDPENIVKRIEDKLSVTIKEMLWEILPPLAEKIIKEEVEKIKQEMENSAS